MLCATTRRTPAASAASTRLRVPVTRISELAWRFPPFRAVSWCIASTPSGTNGGCCEPNIVSTVLLVFVTVMPTLGADRSNNVDHLASDFLYHFRQRLPQRSLQRPPDEPGLLVHPE